MILERDLKMQLGLHRQIHSQHVPDLLEERPGSIDEKLAIDLLTVRQQDRPDMPSSRIDLLHFPRLISHAKLPRHLQQIHAQLLRARAILPRLTCRAADSLIGDVWKMLVDEARVEQQVRARHLKLHPRRGRCARSQTPRPRGFAMAPRPIRRCAPRAP